MNTLQIVLALSTFWLVTMGAAYFTGYWYGEKAAAYAMQRMRNFYNGGRSQSNLRG